MVCDLVGVDQTRRVWEVGSLDSFLIVCHALRLLWGQINRCDDLFHLFFFSSFLLSLCLSTCFQSPGFLRQKGCLSTVSCMFHIGLCDTSVRPEYVVCPTPPWYVSSGHHTYKTYEYIVVVWDRFNFFDGFITIRWEIVPFSFSQVKAPSECSRLWHNNWCDSHTDRAVLCARDWIQNRLLTHIRNVEDTKMRSGLYPFFHIALLNDFGSFGYGWVTICLNLPIVRQILRRYPLWCIPRGYCGCWNLLLRCEAWFFVPVEGVGMVQVVVCTGSVERHREAPQ